MIEDACARPKGVSRRTLIAGVAWSTPVIVGLASAPASAASGTPAPIAIGELSVDAYTISNLNNNGHPGPLQWAGGQIGWWTTAGGQTVGTVTYTVVLTKPDGTTVTLLAGSQTITSGKSYVFDQLVWGTQPMALGTYRITLTVGASGSATKSDSETITLT